MDKKVYVWLFKNINRYNFEGPEANQVKTTMSRMLITEETVNSDEMVAKMQGLYTDFCNLFYNNIFGYQNGLANKPITASELDCYFVKVSDGFIPIGYYRESSPVEAVTMVQKLLESSKNEITAEKNQIIVKWQKNIELIGEKYEKIANSGNPAMIRSIIGFGFSGILIILSLLSLINLRVLSMLLSLGAPNVMLDALSNIPIISNGGFVSWIVYLAFVIVAILVALLGVLLAIKEIKLISDKKSTKEVLNKTVIFVNDLENAINYTVSHSTEGLFQAARRGENMAVQKAESAKSIEKIERQIQKALAYSNKTERQRTGIGYVYLALMVVFMVIFGLSYIPGIGGGIEYVTQLFKGNGDGGESLPDAKPVEEVVEPVEEVVEEEKVSYYEVYKSDASWYTARNEASSRGGALISINDEEEFLKACALAEEAGLKVFWVGMNRGYNENWEDALWEDGSRLYYTRWLSGEPTMISDTGEEETCLMVFKVGGEWWFNDATSDVAQHYTGKMGYIVEFEE